MRLSERNGSVKSLIAHQLADLVPRLGMLSTTTRDFHYRRLHDNRPTLDPLDEQELRCSDSPGRVFFLLATDLARWRRRKTDHVGSFIWFVD